MGRLVSRLRRLLPCTVGGVFFCCGSLAIASDIVLPSAQAVDPYQVFFAFSMRELEQQHYASAISLLEALSKRVASQRVRLELARAYYLDRQYAFARELFEQVLEDATLPWGVRENVNRYLDLIDEALGSIKFAVGVISDSNPLNYTDHREITIAGQTLRLAPPAENRTVHGMQYLLNASRAFTGDASMTGYLNANAKDFEGGDFDRWSLDVGLALAPRAHRRFRGKIGLEEAYYGGDHLYRQPYGTVTFYPDPVEQFRISTELKLAYLDVERFDYLDAFTQTAELRTSRLLPNGSQILGNLYLENAFTDEDAYRYQGVGAGVTLSLPLSNGWGVSSSAATGVRSYQDEDPFFAERREDMTTKLSLVIFNKRWGLFNLTPEFGLSYERTESSIAYYEYDKVMVVLRAGQ